MPTIKEINQTTLPKLPSGEIRYPRGWFCIGASTEFTATAPTPMKYFAKHLVGFRTESGKLCVLDAHCPHLGAHIGYGGKIIGETIQCPFHAWQFNTEGECTEVPYAKHIPKKAYTQVWHTMERSGVAFVWHDPEGNPPHYDIPAMEEYGQAGWTDWNLHRMELATNQREIIENVADSAHFTVVHQMPSVEHFDNSYEDHTATQIMVGCGPGGGGVKTKAIYYGPAFQYTWMKAITDTRLINTNTPIDENTVHLWFGVMIQVSGFTEESMKEVQQKLENLGYGSGFDLSPENLAYVQDAIIDANQKGYYDDVAIWENKLYRPDAILCDGDGPLHKLRQWYAQFYQDRSV